MGYMKRSSQLSRILHILLHLAEQDRPITSATLAKANQTNPVVIRRTMAGLRDKGYVRSEKGHGGGWTLACDLSLVTLHDIYTALGSPSLLALHDESDETGCLVEQSVNAALHKAFQDAEDLLLAQFKNVSLAMLCADVQVRIAARGASPHHLEHAHIS